MKKIIIIPIILLLNLSFALAAVSIINTQNSVTEIEPGVVKAVIGLKNVGTTTSGMFLIEVQPQQTSAFSFMLDQKTCDSKYPKNVFRYVSQVAPQEELKVDLIMRGLNPGTYTLYGVSTNSCCSGPYKIEECYAVNPFGWKRAIGAFTIQAGTTAVCGNGICESAENANTCAKDCGKKGYLGDGVCSAGESYPNEPSCPPPTIQPPPGGNNDDKNDDNNDDKTGGLGAIPRSYIFGGILLLVGLGIFAIVLKK